MSEIAHMIVIKEDRNGKKKVDLFQNRWAFAREMFFPIMYMVANIKLATVYFDDPDKFMNMSVAAEKEERHSWHNLVDEFVEYGDNQIADVHRDVFNDLCDSEEPSMFRDYIDSYLTNHCGMIVVWLKEELSESGRYVENISIRFGLLPGREGNDDKPDEYFNRWMPAQEYFEEYKKYCDKSWQTMFHAMCKHFEIKDMGNI